MQDFIHTLPALNLLFAEITLEGTIQPFVTAIIFIGMIVALMLPILAIPYIFIKMGGAMAKIVSAGNSMVKRGVKKGAGETKYGQAFKQAKSIRADNRRQQGQHLLRQHGGKAGGVLLGGASREGRAMGARRLEAMEREHDAKETAFAKQNLIRRGVKDDARLTALALDPSADKYERRAATDMLGEGGRVKAVRQIHGSLAGTPDSEWVQESISANSGKLYAKAPDLNDGNPHPFASVSPEDAAPLHSSTVRQAITNPKATDADRQEMLSSYDRAMANPNLAAKFDDDTHAAWAELRAAHNSTPGVTPVLPPTTPPPTSSGGGGAGPTPPPSSPPPPQGGGTQPPLPPGASGGRSGSVGPSGLWTPGP